MKQMDWSLLQGLLKKVQSAFGRAGEKPADDGAVATAFGRELEKAEKIAKRKGAQPGLKAVASAFRAAVRDSFGLGYEFTYEELVRRLEQRRLRQGVKQALSAAAEKLVDAEYSGRELSKGEVIALAQDMKKIVGMV